MEQFPEAIASTQSHHEEDILGTGEEIAHPGEEQQVPSADSTTSEAPPSPQIYVSPPPVITPVPVPTDASFNAYGPGPTFQALKQVFQTVINGEDYVELLPVPSRDLEACAEGRFVTPKRGWMDAQGRLDEYGVVVLIASPGSGRRTAALRLLADATQHGSGWQLFDLETAWVTPRVSLLPDTSDCGFILDMSESSEQLPPIGFGANLLEWGKKGKERGSMLVLLTTEEVWQGRWTEGARNIAVSLSSPDAERLVAAELAAQGFDGRISWLEDDAFGPIWESKPRAEDARRLAERIINSQDKNLALICDEYSDWRNWIEEHLNSTSESGDLISRRVMLWSGALANGARRESVLRVADALLAKLGRSRNPVSILSDATSSERFKWGKIVREGERVRLDPERHGLSSAVLHHLWDEFITVHETLRTWAVEQAVTLPADDAALVVDALVEIAVRHRDGAILRELRDTLSVRRPVLAVRALTTAALDEKFGAYVRERLYTWLLKSPSQHLIDLVAEVCGGELGQRRPDIALVRLCRAAGNSKFNSSALAAAFTSVARYHPTKVRESVDAWLAEPKLRRAGVAAFLALASTDYGRRLLYGEGGAALQDYADRTALVRSWQHILADPEARPQANSILAEWGSDAEKGFLPREPMIQLLSAALAPYLNDNIMASFLPKAAQLDLNSFWGQVLVKAVPLLQPSRSITES
jgi:hypothetical protein